MKQRSRSRWLRLIAGFGFVVLSASSVRAVEPSPAGLAGFNSYAEKVESRLAREHRSPSTFIVPEDSARLRNGQIIVEQLTSAGGDDLPGALLHDWRGTAFVPGATVADFERLMEDFGAYPQHYAPQVVSSRVLSRNGGHFNVLMRVRQLQVITVVMDITFDVVFDRLNALHGYSISHSKRIDEIASTGTRGEYALSPAAAHGFLWRLDTYWSYAQQDKGLFIQVESISLTRSIPKGLGWAIGPFVERVPRQSLEFTLQSTCEALRR